MRDPGIVEFVADQGVKFVTTSAGSPTRYTAALKEAGLTVFHVVPDLAGALKAVDAGVDGLVVEGGEGGGFNAMALFGRAMDLYFGGDMEPVADVIRRCAEDCLATITGLATRYPSPTNP